jgi:hypothetical protein
MRRPFLPGNPGKKKGARDRRTAVGIEVCRAMAGHAADRLLALVDSRSHRVSLEASKLVLAYAWGAPRQTLELAGGFADLSKELSEALAEARARRAALEAPMPVQVILDAPLAIPALAAGDETVTLPSEATKEATPAPAIPETNAQGGVTP